ncbi:glycosyltransferase [Vibrio cholerae]|uniref:glycosyltransferase n=1 Tax=Vibrio cholerae TaxID=666 RepID=UPI0029C42AA6|nr:glycosyltransferase [Vibrio cholerae]MDX5009867.1 glycosyltransferase [Vibrio cholerae]
MIKINIVIATYNSEKTLRQCLDSVLYQSFDNYNIFVKDGGSSDNTLSILNEYRGKFTNISVVTGLDSGVYDAWNTAIEFIEDGWVTFLGSDDFFTSSDSLANIVLEIEKIQNSDIKVIYGRNFIVDDEGNIVEEVGEPWYVAKENIYKEMTIRHPGCFCHYSLLQDLNGFDGSFKIIGDYDFILRAIKISQVHFYDFSAVCHRVGGLSISPSRCMQVIRETYRLRKKHGLKPHVYMDSLFFKRLVLFLLSKILSDTNVLLLIRRFKNK